MLCLLTGGRGANNNLACTSHFVQQWSAHYLIHSFTMELTSFYHLISQFNKITALEPFVTLSLLIRLNKLFFYALKIFLSALFVHWFALYLPCALRCFYLTLFLFYFFYYVFFTFPYCIVLSYILYLI